MSSRLAFHPYPAFARFTQLAATAGLALQVTAANAAMSLTSPVDGSYLKSPSAVTYGATGSRTSSLITPTITLSGPGFTQTSWWYSGTTLTQNFTTTPPNNAWLTAKLNDGGFITTKTYRTAFPYYVPASIESGAATEWYYTFPPGYCTTFASRAFHSGPSIYASFIPWRGNARDWMTNAYNAGWKTTRTTTEAQIGAVIVWRGGTYGHVGVITDLDKTTTPGVLLYTIREMNWGAPTGVDGVTTNFGKVTGVQLRSNALNRGSYMFDGFVLPVRR